MDSAEIAARLVTSDHSQDQSWRSARLIFQDDDECRLLMLVAVTRALDPGDRMLAVETVGRMLSDAGWTEIRLSPFLEAAGALVTETCDLPEARAASTFLSARGRSSGVSFVGDALSAWSTDCRRALASEAAAAEKPPRQRRWWQGKH